jgi:hypothetical protein
MHLVAPVPTLAQVCPTQRVSAELETFVQQAMAKQREARFQDAAEMLNALEALPQPWLWADGSEPTSGIALASSLLSPMPVEIAGAAGRSGRSLLPFAGKRGVLLGGGLALCGIILLGALLAKDLLPRGAARTSPVAVVAEAVKSTPPTRPEAAPSAAAQDTPEPAPLPEPATAEAESAASPADPAPEPAPEEATAVANIPTPAAEPQPADEAAVLHDEVPKPPPPARVVPRRVPARNPWARSIPRELRAIHSAVSSGSIGTERTIVALRNYNRANAEDPRGHLLLAHLYLNRNWRADALNQYTIAYRLDASARGASQLLSDLIEIATRGPVTNEAARLLREAFGSEALSAVDRAIGAHKKEPDAANRLRALRARLAMR